MRARAEDIRRYSSSSEDEIVVDASSKRLKRRRSKRSKRFQSSLSKALREKFELLSNRKENLGIYCDVKGIQDTYFVTISNNPSCNCPYYLCKQNNVVQICKHLVWVYVRIIGLSTDDDAIHQVSQDGRELKRILGKAPHFTPTTVAETTPKQPRLHMPSANTLLPYTLATNTVGVTTNSTCLSSPANVLTQPVPTLCNTVPVFTQPSKAIQGPGNPNSAFHFPVVTLPAHTSLRPGNNGNFQGNLTDAEVEGIFSTDPRDRKPQLWYADKMVRSSTARCASCSNIQMVPGVLNVQVSGLWIPRGRRAAIERTFYLCAHPNCLSRRPPFSNVRVPPPVINASANSFLEDRDFAILHERCLPLSLPLQELS